MRYEMWDMRYGTCDLTISEEYFINKKRFSFQPFWFRHVSEKLNPGIVIVILALLLSYSPNLFCQQDTIATKTDSVQISDTSKIVTDTSSRTRVKETYKPFTPSKSALLAVGLSAAIPGAGQVYVESYWKVAVIWGLGSYWIYEWSSLNKNYKDYREKFSQSVLDSPPNGDDQLRGQRDYYRDERDKFAWYLGLLYFLNVVDAYVGASLYDFEVTPDLSPSAFAAPGIRATYHFRF